MSAPDEECVFCGRHGRVALWIILAVLFVGLLLAFENLFAVQLVADP